ncbi:B3 DNA binding domain [Macleaya cordata]|uniref:B3 DNA binding domain n=1 Tax=Macleaya cordata TaxID=56857 RepID=A0A200QZB7_MACCD|nr:B3 DNA binding domain [Macleaya cordata]
MVMSKRTYEELRLQRLEENKKRMEDLKLNHLALNLKSSSPKPSPVKQAKPRMIQRKLEFVEVRRSSRFSNKPTPVYREIAVARFERSKRSFKPRNLTFAVASEEDRENAREKAEELESTLGNEFPSFVKPMLHSHVYRGFWLGLPVQFCKKNLPKRDETITLVDEMGEEYATNFLAQKTGLSGGWKGFSVAHGLVDGDALVFQLIKPTKFKVYIIRVNGSE